MNKINWKRLNIAFWTEIVLSYFLPFKFIDNFQYEVGFPISFLTLYDTATGIGSSPFTSMYLNPLAFLVNGILIYLLISFTIKMYHKIKQKYSK